IESRGGGEWLTRLEATDATLTVLQRVGSTPLPPYIRRQRKARGQVEHGQADVDRYNTVFATAPGSVAAPTAGLHFTDELLARLAARGVGRAAVTLHVGPGT